MAAGRLPRSWSFASVSLVTLVLSMVVGVPAPLNPFSTVDGCVRTFRLLAKPDCWVVAVGSRSLPPGARPSTAGDRSHGLTLRPVGQPGLHSKRAKLRCALGVSDGLANIRVVWVVSGGLQEESA
jgi:hypothetical protein